MRVAGSILASKYCADKVTTGPEGADAVTACRALLLIQGDFFVLGLDDPMA